jgi:Cytochrome c7 and related cytochrome c
MAASVAQPLRAALVAACALTAIACGAQPSAQAPQSTTSTTSTTSTAGGVFTTARPTLSQATRDFFRIRPTPAQPIPFPHKTHIEKGLSCTEYCHEAVTKGPIAGLPSVKTCMICHDAIATDRPLIQQVAAIQKSGRDLAWQRVYGYPNESHVRFNHAPHIRANVECATCHGPVAQQTVAERNVNLNMGFCVNCHREKNAPNDCLTCHF